MWKKMVAFLFSIGLISGISNAEDVINTNFTMPSENAQIMLSERMNEEISFERNFNNSIKPFNDNVSMYYNNHYSHYSHSSHYSHYSHYSSRY